MLTNRLARIVDRARTLEGRLESRTGKAKELHADLAGAGAARALHQRGDLAVRRRRRHGGGGGGDAVRQCLLRLGIAGVIASLFVGSLLLLSAAFIAFFIEVRYATAALRIGGTPYLAAPQAPRPHKTSSSRGDLLPCAPFFGHRSFEPAAGRSLRPAPKESAAARRTLQPHP